MLRILFLSAYVTDTPKLYTNGQFDFIKSQLRPCGDEEHIQLMQQDATSRNDLKEILTLYNPHIVHFTYHGRIEGPYIFQNPKGFIEKVPPNVLANLLKISKNVRCVILNGCYTERLANAISTCIDCIVYMPLNSDMATSDLVIGNFAATFYGSIGNGESIRHAYFDGLWVLEHLNTPIPREILPRLISRAGIDPSYIYLS